MPKSYVELSPYRAHITREAFLFFEMRITARLLCEGLSDMEATERIVNENLFQYPTEKTIKGMAKACIILVLQSLNIPSIVILARMCTKIKHIY